MMLSYFETDGGNCTTAPREASVIVSVGGEQDNKVGKGSQVRFQLITSIPLSTHGFEMERISKVIGIGIYGFLNTSLHLFENTIYAS